MQAIVYTQYGTPDVLRLQEVTQPAPQSDQVLVQIQAAAINMGDWYTLTGSPWLVRLMTGGLFRPKYPILGMDIAGQVAVVGRDVRGFKPGDAVIGDLSAVGLGGFAQYVAVPAKALTAKPAPVTFEEAAALPTAGVTALQAVRDKGQVQPGQRVLIYGASGGVGTFVVQLAKVFGAEVTACCSTSKVEQVRGLGADHVVDYTQTDITQQRERYDVIIAVNGYHPIWVYRRLLTPQGRYVMVGGTMAQIFQALLLGPLLTRQGITMTSVQMKPHSPDLAFLAELLAAGKLRPVIERCHPLAEAAAALHYVGAGRARGKIVLTMTHPTDQPA